MKKVLLFFILVILLLVTVTMDLCPFYTTDISDTNSFGKYNRYVDNFLNKNSILLNFEKNEFKEVIDYHYHYTCALLGDPAFYIVASVKYYNNDIFNTDIIRILNDCCEKEFFNQSEILCLGIVEKYVEMFFDDKLNSGMRFLFETAEIDLETKIIKYSYAVWWDYMSKDIIVTEIAQKVAQIQSQENVNNKR